MAKGVSDERREASLAPSCMIAPLPSVTSPPLDSAAVRRGMVDALRLDLIGPRPSDMVLQRERLP